MWLQSQFILFLIDKQYLISNNIRGRFKKGWIGKRISGCLYNICKENGKLLLKEITYSNNMVNI